MIFHQLVNHDGSSFRFKAKQGEAIERPGTIEVEIQLEKGEAVEVSVSGKAVIVFQSELIL